MLHSFFPAYFHWWHIPVIFLAGLVGESYGCLIGGGSIVLLAVQNFLGVPLKSAIAINNSAVLGTEFGVLSETHEQVLRNKKLVVLMMLPLILGGITGTWLLLTISPEVVKYVMSVAVLIVLGHTYIGKSRVRHEFISKSRYILLFVFLFLTGLYSNLVSLGGGTFSKFAIISVLGLTFIEGQGLSAASGIPNRIYSLIATSIAGLIVWPYVITFWVSTFIAGKYATRFVKHIPDIYLKVSLAIISIGFVAYLLLAY
jgi:uncharacterized membrane protein YfcA